MGRIGNTDKYENDTMVTIEDFAIGTDKLTGETRTYPWGDIVALLDQTGTPIVSVTFAELVALTNRKAGDRFDLSDTIYAGRIHLVGTNTFDWQNAIKDIETIVIA